jgi:type IV pilus assembly protein PilA
MHHDTLHPQQGFNLIELMVTVAAIGILATIAVPAYQDYTIRTKVGEALGMGSAAKVAVATNAAVGRLQDINQSTSGYEALSNPGRYVAKIEIEDEGVIVMTTRNTGAAVDPVLELKPTTTGGAIDWECRLREGLAPHVPINCRKTTGFVPAFGQIPGSYRNNLVIVASNNAQGGVTARSARGETPNCPPSSNSRCTRNEPALLQNMTPSLTGTLNLNDISVSGTSGGWGVAIQGRGEGATFTGYTVQFEPSGVIVLREWSNGVESGWLNPTPIPAGFDINNPGDIAVRVDGGKLSVTDSNGLTLFNADIPNPGPGVFGLRTWGNTSMTALSSQVTANK